MYRKQNNKEMTKCTSGVRKDPYNSWGLCDLLFKSIKSHLPRIPA